MPSFIDRTGQRFGMLVVRKRVIIDDNKKSTYWECICDCGNVKIVDASHLVSGDTKSCGCFNRKLLSERRTTHGMTGTKIYYNWVSMLQRCTNPDKWSYKHYGGRGIAVCDDWYFFENFLADMGDSYKEGLTLDRIDNDSGYSPENCRWATMKEQANNRRNTIFVEYAGMKKTLVEWSIIINTQYKTMNWRYKRGWDSHDILFGRG